MNNFLEHYTLFLFSLYLTTFVTVFGNEDQNIPINAVTEDNGVTTEVSHVLCRNGYLVREGGWMVCKCRPGYGKLPKTRNSLEACEKCNCGKDFGCKLTRSWQGFTVTKCHCPAGYTESGRVCIADCKENPCQNEGKCLVVSGEDIECSCRPPYAGKFCQTKCECGDNGNCGVIGDRKFCSCFEGYEENNGTCEECNCGDYGKCTFMDGNRRCICSEGYQENNGICEKCDCGENGTCSFRNGQKRCYCEDGYAENNGICESCDCGKSGKCSFVSGEKKCWCAEGFEEIDGVCKM